MKRGSCKDLSSLFKNDALNGFLLFLQERQINMAKKDEEKKSDRLKKSILPDIITHRVDNWLDRNESGIFVMLCILTIVFSLMLFNMRISEGGDDATYVKAGYDYSKHFTTYYFSFNAPGYPMFLSIPIKLFGLNLLPLKFLSVVFYFFGFYFLYKGFRKRVRPVILFPIVFIMAVNSCAQYFASQTYNEAFYLFFQGLFFFLFFRLEDSINSEKDSVNIPWTNWLGFGLIMFILAFVKNVAIVAVPATVLYFILNRRFVSAGLTVASYLTFRIPFELIKSMIWGNINQFSAQGDILKLKDPYDRSKGYEDMAGYFGRLFDNINIYLGKRFWEILGLFGKDPAVDDTSRELYSFLAKVFLFILLAVFVALVLKKKSKPLLLVVLYLAMMLIASFFALQARWDQPRIIIIFVPLLLMLLFYGMLSVLEKSSIGASLFILIICLLSLSSFISSVKRTGENLPVLAKNIRGDIYAGYTPDWVNFLRMSRWCADSLPPEALVASRKAPMSFIYGKGKEFFPVYRIIAYDTLTHQSNPDSVWAYLKKNKVTHVMYASLRMDPKNNSGNIINTMNNLFDPVRQK
jgi:hypothetical protein